VNRENQKHQRQVEAQKAMAQEVREVLALLQASAMARQEASRGPTVTRSRNGIVSQIHSTEAIADATQMECAAIGKLNVLVVQMVAQMLAAERAGLIRIDEGGQVVPGPKANAGPRLVPQ
jgi:hypothetical protein